MLMFSYTYSICHWITSFLQMFSCELWIHFWQVANQAVWWVFKITHGNVTVWGDQLKSCYQFSWFSKQFTRSNISSLTPIIVKVITAESLVLKETKTIQKNHSCFSSNEHYQDNYIIENFVNIMFLHWNSVDPYQFIYFKGTPFVMFVK